MMPILIEVRSNLVLQLKAHVEELGRELIMSCQLVNSFIQKMYSHEEEWRRTGRNIS